MTMDEFNCIVMSHTSTNHHTTIIIYLRDCNNYEVYLLKY